MDKLKELREQLKNLVAEMRKIIDLSTTEKRDLTEDEAKRFDQCKAEKEILTKQIERLEEIVISERQLKTIAPEQIPPIGPEGGLPLGQEPEQRKQDVKVTGNPPLFRNFGEFLQRVALAGICLHENQTDPRVDELRKYNNELRRKSGFAEERITGMGETIPADGGFLVQQEFANELMKKTYQTGVLGSRVRKMGLSQPNSNGIKIPAIDETSRADGSRWGGIRAYWTEEGGTKTASKPKFAELNLQLNKLTGLCYATDEMLQDSAILNMVISDGFAEEFGFKLDDAIINGTGAGMPLGILNAPCLVSVAKETNQTATTIVSQNIFKMWSRCFGRSRQNAIWMINQDIEPQLFSMSIAVGTGGNAIYLPANGAADRPFSTLMGRPVVAIEQCQTLGTVGDIILGDLSQYIMIDKGAIQAASSIHVNFIYDETAFRFVYRCDGQPWWTSTLTPFTGSNTLSPFVALASRT